MAKVTTEVHNGHLRTIVELEPGEQVSLCRCWKSGKFPFCDGTHKTLEGNVGSVRVKAPALVVDDMSLTETPIAPGKDGG